VKLRDLIFVSDIFHSIFPGEQAQSGQRSEDVEELDGSVQENAAEQVRKQLFPLKPFRIDGPISDML
jgi:hypothetical protein